MKHTDRIEVARIFKALAYEGGQSERLATNLDISPNTLRADLAGLERPPEAGRAPNILNVNRALEIMDDTDALPFIEFLCRRYGYRMPVKKAVGKPSGRDLHRGLTRVSQDFGILAGRIEDATDGDGPGGMNVTADELADIIETADRCTADLDTLKTDAEASAKSAAVVDIGQARKRG